MKPLAWAGIAAFWVGATIVVALVASGVIEARSTVTAAGGDATYDFVVFTSPETEMLLGDPPEGSRISLRSVASAEEAMAALADGSAKGIVLDARSAVAVPTAALQAAYDNSQVIVAFEVRPTWILRGGCAGAIPPCEGNLHEGEPAIAFSRRSGDSYSEGETVIHPFSPEVFFELLALRTDQANGVGR